MPVARSKNNWTKVLAIPSYTSPCFSCAPYQSISKYFRLIVGVWLLCFHCVEKRNADRSRKWVGEVQRIPANRPIPAEQRLRELGIELPIPPQPFGTYKEVVQAGSLLFLSGMLPTEGSEARYIGREFTVSALLIIGNRIQFFECGRECIGKTPDRARPELLVLRLEVEVVNRPDKMLRRFQFALYKRFIDDYLGGNICQFTFLPGLNLFSHGLEIALHSVDTDGNAVDQRERLRVFREDRDKHA